MGLLKTAAKASIATRVAGNVHRRQQNRWAVEDAARAQAAAQAAPPAPVMAPPVQQAVPVAPAPMTAPPTQQADPLEQLRQLGELRGAGVLSEAEFEAAKQPIIARMSGN